MIYEKIWQKILNPDEKVEYEFSVSDRYKKICLICFGIISVVLIIYPPHYIGVLALLMVSFYFGFYLKVANAYAFTQKRVIIHRGWLSTTTISIDYEKITDVTVNEPLLDKVITHTGHLIINTAGTGFPEVILTCISRPHEIKKKLDKLRGQLPSESEI